MLHLASDQTVLPKDARLEPNIAWKPCLWLAFAACQVIIFSQHALLGQAFQMHARHITTQVLNDVAKMPLMIQVRQKHHRVSVNVQAQIFKRNMTTAQTLDLLSQYTRLLLKKTGCPS